MIKIAKKVPIPEVTGRGRKAIYPWKQMKVGDSFFVPNKTTQQFGASLGQARLRLKMKFTQRTEKSGVRVWRIK